MEKVSCSSNIGISFIAPIPSRWLRWCRNSSCVQYEHTVSRIVYRSRLRVLLLSQLIWDSQIILQSLIIYIHVNLTRLERRTNTISSISQFVFRRWVQRHMECRVIRVLMSLQVRSEIIRKGNRLMRDSVMVQIILPPLRKDIITESHSKRIKIE